MKQLVLLVLVSVFLPHALANEFDLAIENVTVIDGASAVRTNQTVYITDGQIKKLTKSQVLLPAAKVIDGRGQFLIPGLWDMHVHIVYEESLIESMPSLFLDYGITSVRDTGALLEEILPEVQRWQALGLDAPDLYFSGPLLDGSLVVYDGNGRPEIGVANPSIESALMSLQALQKAEVDFIKIYELVSPEVFDALVAAAQKAELPIAAHVPLSMKAEVAGPQVNSMEHLRNVEIACANNAPALHQVRKAEILEPADKSGFELRSHLHGSQRPSALETADPKSDRCQQVIAALTNTIQVPTLRLNTLSQYSPLDRSDWPAALDQLPKALSAQWSTLAKQYASTPSQLRSDMSKWSLALVEAMNQRGVPIGAGTDTPIGLAIPGYSLHTELERLVDAGLTPKQAIAAATIRPAEFFRMEERIGRVAVGMEADLLLLNANPLDDIRNTRAIEQVISNGVVVR